jgi:hypothetical protein
VTASLRDENDAATAVANVELRFQARPRSDSDRALVEIAQRWPRTAGGERALLWRGDLLLQQHRADEALVCYDTVRAWAVDDRSSMLALRGEANVALEKHQWRKAMRELKTASAYADGAAILELHEKYAIAAREQLRYEAELISWLAIAICVLVLLARIRRATILRVPIATKFLAPIYALFLLLAWHRDPKVFQALMFIAGGSLLLTSLAFVVPPPHTRARRLALASVLTVVNLALLYVSFRRAGLIDALLETLAAGPEAS